jgi:hypothetical protein
MRCLLSLDPIVKAAPKTPSPAQRERAAYEPVMTDNHRGVIGVLLMALTNAEKQASWHERHLKNENGAKLRAQFIFDASTRASSSGSLAQGVARCRLSSRSWRRALVIRFNDRHHFRFVSRPRMPAEDDRPQGFTPRPGRPDGERSRPPAGLGWHAHWNTDNPHVHLAWRRRLMAIGPTPTPFARSMRHASSSGVVARARRE